jgi:hypothetical protein
MLRAQNPNVTFSYDFATFVMSVMHSSALMMQQEAQTSILIPTINVRLYELPTTTFASMFVAIVAQPRLALQIRPHAHKR